MDFIQKQRICTRFYKTDVRTDIEKVKVYDWEIEFYDILSNVIRIHIRKGLTEKEAMWFKTQGAKVRRIEGTEREIGK